MATKDWSASQYLKFEAERTRPSRDLLAAIPVESPQTVVDLGCGPGNSTAVLAKHYPEAQIMGMDSSPNLIEKAKATLPHIHFELGDLNSYKPKEAADILFSNAVFQWIPRESRIETMKKLIKTLAPGGVFAFQVPDNFNEPSHQAMRHVAQTGPWASTVDGGEPARGQFQSPGELYDELKPLCSSVDIWHTFYQHALENHQAIVEWVKATGLKPFIDSLSAEDSEAFLKTYHERLQEVYPLRYDGKVLLRYPRMFVVAVRG